MRINDLRRKLRVFRLESDFNQTRVRDAFYAEIAQKRTQDCRALLDSTALPESRGIGASAKLGIAAEIKGLNCFQR